MPATASLPSRCLKLDKVFVERGVSGSLPLAERPEGAALLAVSARRHHHHAEAGPDVPLGPRCARHARQPEAGRIVLHMIDLGGDTTGNGMSKLVFTILSAVAEAERDRIRERIAEVKRDQPSGAVSRRRGAVRLPVGDAGELVPVPEQQAAIRRMRKLRDQGLALRTIAAKMKASGVSISHAG